MAIVDYKLVYRDGANTGAPVTSFKLADTIAELTPGLGVEGDLAYAKNTDIFYAHNGSTWFAVGVSTPFNGGKITNGIYIEATGIATPSDAAQLVAKHPSYNAPFRIINWANETYITHNMVYGWSRSDPNIPAHLLAFQGSTSGFGFYVITTGNTLVEIARINATGLITGTGLQINGTINVTGGVDCQNWIRARGGSYQYSNPNADGTWVDVPYSSGNFFSPQGGTWTVDSSQIHCYNYTVIGKTCHINIWLVGSSLTGATVSYLAIRLPITANKNFAAPCSGHNPAYGWGNSPGNGVLYGNAGGAEFYFNPVTPPFQVNIPPGPVTIAASFAYSI